MERVVKYEGIVERNHVQIGSHMDSHFPVYLAAITPSEAEITYFNKKAELIGLNRFTRGSRFIADNSYGLLGLNDRYLPENDHMKAIFQVLGNHSDPEYLRRNLEIKLSSSHETITNVVQTLSGGMIYPVEEFTRGIMSAYQEAEFRHLNEIIDDLRVFEILLQAKRIGDTLRIQSLEISQGKKAKVTLRYDTP
jgi:hypothetical protein